MRKFIARFTQNESGATAIEYGLIAAFMAVCLIAAMPSITGGVGTQFGNIGSEMSKTTR